MSDQLSETTVSTTNPDRVHVTGRPELLFDVSGPVSPGGARDEANPEQLYAAALASCLHQAVVAPGRTSTRTWPTNCAEQLTATVAREAMKACPLASDVRVDLDQTVA